MSIYRQERLFSFVKSLRRDNSRVAPLKEHGRLHDDRKDQADSLYWQYESTWTREDQEDIPIPDGTPYPSLTDISITEEVSLNCC